MEIGCGENPVDDFPGASYQNPAEAHPRGVQIGAGVGGRVLDSTLPCPGGLWASAAAVASRVGARGGVEGAGG